MGVTRQVSAWQHSSPYAGADGDGRARQTARLSCRAVTTRGDNLHISARTAAVLVRGKAGFVVEGLYKCFVITAGHWPSKLPGGLSSYTEAPSYASLSDPAASFTPSINRRPKSP